MNKSENILIGERLHQYRENLGYSREEFAETLGMSVGNYKRIESGRVEISADKIARISNTYGHLDILWLLTGEQPIVKIFGREFRDLDELWNDTSDDEKKELGVQVMQYALDKMKRTDNKKL